MNEMTNGFGDGGWWVLLLFILLGGNGFGGNGMNGAYPWLNNTMTTGFADQTLNTTLNGIRDSITNGFNSAEVSANARQMADMNQNFALQTLIQGEGSATRLAIQQQTQAILDKICAQEVENLRAANVSLQNQVNMLNLAASQTAQTATLIADNTAQTQYLVNRISPYPVPAYTVTNPNTPAA